MAVIQVGPSGPSFRTPPESLRRLDPQLYDYLLALHATVAGISPETGKLDQQNIDVANLKGIDHANLIDVQPYQHHGAGEHQILDQASAVDDAGQVVVTPASATPSAVAIVGSAGATYTAAEKNLINALANGVNQLVADLNALVTVVNQHGPSITAAVDQANAAAAKINDVLARLRAAHLVAA